MRKNLPVTNVETKVRADQYLISRTDKKGKITYANPAFLEISGFTQDEIIGQPHNLIRHPDMPAEAFQDLWDTLQANKPWLGMVKNRRKDGGFYWLLANAAPICEHGEVTGYASVRIKPTEEQIQEAEAFYASVNAGQSTGYAIKHGQRVRRSWRRIADVAALPFANTIRSRMLRMAALSVAAVGSATYFAATGGFPAQYHWWITGGLAAASAGIVVLAWQIAQSITQPLDGAAEIARQIAAGNLQVEIDSEAPGEVGRLYFYLDLMRKSLMGIATDVHAGVDAATQAAQKLQANNTRLSARTEDQASSLQQTAASMEELTVTVKQNADNAHAANRLANDSMAIAQRGGNAVNEVVATMHGIHDSSKKIADIVSLIEGIAFQTNILALNAAVESARAGEAGRSFAVVAGEVRNLAQKSSVAAKEIKVLIDDSVSRIATGSTQAASAGDTMQEIVDSVRRVTDIMGEISLASIEQSSGLEQINQAVAQMDIVTQQNAGLVQDLGLTVHDLTNEAQALNTAIGALNTGRNSSAIGRQSVARALPGTQRSSHAMAISTPSRALEYAQQ